MLATIALALLVVGAGALAGGWWWVQRSMQQPSAQASTVIIERGTPFRALTAQLHQAGALADSTSFLAYVLLTRQQASLQAGEYAFAAGTTPLQVLGKLQRGEVVVRQITIPEGWTSGRILAALRAAEGLTGELPTSLPEASLLPDTYRYQRNETRAALLARMQQAANDFLSNAWAARSPRTAVRTPQEALILASIVERETGTPAERPMVAAVFNNRLRQGMPLQADPTVIYGITRGTTELGRPLSKADLRALTPYNTYTLAGLPAGPICHPGREAILATLHPAESTVLYFVADGSGAHRFSSTLAEHNAYVAALRAVERQRQAAAAR